MCASQATNSHAFLLHFHYFYMRQLSDLSEAHEMDECKWGISHFCQTYIILA